MRMAKSKATCWVRASGRRMDRSGHGVEVMLTCLAKE